MITADLRALSFIQPMGWAITTDHPRAKRIENRPQDLPKAMRGVETVVAVHAGKKWSDEYANAIARIMGVESIPIQEGIIGLMTLTGHVYRYDAARKAEHQYETLPMRTTGDGSSSKWRLDDWFSGPFGYEISNAVALLASIPCPGALGFWRVSEALRRNAQLEDAYTLITIRNTRAALERELATRTA